MLAKGIIGQNEKGLLVDRSDSGPDKILRFQFVALNSDCPSSPVKAVQIQAMKPAGSPYFASLGLIFKEYPASVALINRRLEGTGLRVSSGPSTTPPGEPIRAFLSPILGNTEAAGTHYELAFNADDKKLQEILCILHERGLIGDAILQSGSKFSTVMGNDMVVNARKLIEDPLEKDLAAQRIAAGRKQLPPGGRGA